MKKAVSALILTVVIFYSVVTLAAEKVVVIPVNITKKIKNIITVSAKGGDFTDPVSAVESITDASIENPYLVLIGPGIYHLSQTLVMKPYVSISGSGQEVTKLTGAFAASSDLCLDCATINGANDVTLSNLTIENIPTAGNTGHAIHNMNSSPIIRDVAVKLSGNTVGNHAVYNNSSSSPAMINMTINVESPPEIGGYCSGVSNKENSSPSMSNVKIAIGGQCSNAVGVHTQNGETKMENVTVDVKSGMGAFGITNEFSDTKMINVTATVSGGSLVNIGVANNSSSPEMFNIVVKASGAGISNVFGIRNTSQSNPVMTNIIATASGEGGPLYGLSNEEDASPTIMRSTFKGGTLGMYLNVGSPRIMNSSIIGGVQVDAGTPTCINSNNGVDKELDASCSVIP